MIYAATNGELEGSSCANKIVESKLKDDMHLTLLVICCAENQHLPGGSYLMRFII